MDELNNQEQKNEVEEEELEYRYLNPAKGDGTPYIERGKEYYNNLSEEEKKKADKLREKLFKKFGQYESDE